MTSCLLPCMTQTLSNWNLLLPENIGPSGANSFLSQLTHNERGVKWKCCFPKKCIHTSFGIHLCGLVAIFSEETILTEMYLLH